jgi:hypothetical protein
MRLYIKEETENAYLLYSVSFAERWIPKKAVEINLKSGRDGMYGLSYEMKIQQWALTLDKRK